MVYVSVATRVPEELASEFKTLAEGNGLTTSMALKYLIQDALKKPDQKLLPYWELFRDMYRRIDSDLTISFTVLERIPFIYQALSTILENQNDMDHAQKVKIEEDKWRKMINQLGENYKIMLAYDKERLNEMEAQLKEMMKTGEEKWDDNK